MSAFIGDKVHQPHAYVQWKNTSVCMDFHCECGAHLHYDGYDAYCVKCPHCGLIWEMPCYVFPRKADHRTPEYWIKNPHTMEPDEDMNECAVDVAQRGGDAAGGDDHDRPVGGKMIPWIIVSVLAFTMAANSMATFVLQGEIARLTRAVEWSQAVAYGPGLAILRVDEFGKLTVTGGTVESWNKIKEQRE